MTRRQRALIGAGALGLVAVGAWMVARDRVEAADHTDPPARTTGSSADRASDIGDLFAWHTGDGHVVLVLTYAGPTDPMAGQTAMYDPDVLYGIHIDTNHDQMPDQELWIRFGQNASGDWGVQIEGIPGGTPATQSGPVETMNTISGPTGGYFWAGLRDDPFFFDLQGFMDTLSTGTLSFMSTRDFFAGKNISAVVIQLATSDIGAGTFDVWATTARIGG